MNYSDDQYDVMVMLDKGFVWDNPEESVKEIIWFLESEGIARSRVDIRENFWTLTEKGKACLAEKRLREEKSKQETEKAAKEETDKQKEKRADRAHDWKILIAGFLLGIIADHFLEIAALVIRFFSSLWIYLFG